MSEQEVFAERVADLIHDLPQNVVGELVAGLQDLLPSSPLTEVAELLARGVPSMTRGHCIALVEAMRGLDPPLDPPTLARILLVAACSDRRRREEQTVEVVWSGPVDARTTLRRSEQALLETIQAARRDMWVVSFVVYKIPEVRQALLDAVGRGVRTSLLLETVEASEGSLDFDGTQALASVRARGARVYEWPLDNRGRDASGKPGLLHAKACVVDRQRLLVSSANLTGKAFDLNMELGLLVRGGIQPAMVARQLDWLVEEKVIAEIT